MAYYSVVFNAPKAGPGITAATLRPLLQNRGRKVHVLNNPCMKFPWNGPPKHMKQADVGALQGAPNMGFYDRGAGYDSLSLSCTTNTQEGVLLCIISSARAVRRQSLLA